MNLRVRLNDKKTYFIVYYSSMIIFYNKLYLLATIALIASMNGIETHDIIKILFQWGIHKKKQCRYFISK